MTAAFIAVAILLYLAVCVFVFALCAMAGRSDETRWDDLLPPWEGVTHSDGKVVAMASRRRPVVLFEGAPKSLRWYEDPYTVLEVGRWLESRGDLPPLPDQWGELFEKPFHFEQEWSEYRRSLLDRDEGPRSVA